VETRTGSSTRRSALLPRSRWARFALLLLVLFALLRSVLWASVQPAWFAPDEDYHWLYINYLVEEHAVPSLDKPFYTAELYKAALLTQQATYAVGPRTSYSGDPHAVLRHLGGSSAERKPALPKPRPVLHPPLYHLGGALVDLALSGKVSVTRMTGIRYYSAVLGALTIFFAWLLAAQVLAREWQQLAAAALVATQPILAFSASTITNDVAVAAVLTATLAWCAWMLRSPPAGRQGIGLGLLLAAALFTKATMISLVLIAAVTLLLLWRTYPSAGRELVRITLWAIALPVALVGWWYVRLVIVTGSVLGERGSLTSASGAHARGIAHVFSVAWQWLSDVYRSYWIDYNSFEVRHTDVWFWLPVVGIAIVAAGLVLFIRRCAGTLTSSKAPELRQVLMLALAALVLLIPPFALDVLRGVRGLPFTTEQGRFLTPAYPGLAVIAIIALRELAGRRQRIFPLAVALVVGAAFVLYLDTWIVWVLERFYGPIGGDWLRALGHASYDKPTFVTQTSLAVLLVAMVASFLAAYGVTVRGASGEHHEHRGPAPSESPGSQQLATHAAEGG
jgi:Dolichyl-phosphate-mannose-protein mannosyltransferase